MAWTSPRTWVVGEILTAALLNVHLRDNVNYLYGSTGQVTLSTAAGPLMFSSATGDKINFGSAAYGFGLSSTELSVYFSSGGQTAFRSTGIGGTAWAALSTTALKHILNRKGGSTSAWTTAGTNNYVDTDAFIQAGVITLTHTTADQTSLVVNLPVTLSTTGSAIAVATIVSNGIRSAVSAVISGTTGVQITMTHAIAGSTFPTATQNVNWIVIGR